MFEGSSSQSPGSRTSEGAGEKTRELVEGEDIGVDVVVVSAAVGVRGYFERDYCCIYAVRGWRSPIANPNS